MTFLLDRYHTISFRVVSGPGELSDDLLYANDVGTILVEASQAGNANYESAVVQRAILVSTSAQLSAGVSDDKLLLTWPENYGNIQLESAENLNGPWTPIVVPDRSENRTEIAVDGQLRFFRLKLN